MADTQFMRVTEKIALAYDERQWVIQRREMNGDDEKWRATYFVKSNKYELWEILWRKSGVSIEEAFLACESLPETFDEFRSQIAAGKTPYAPVDGDHDGRGNNDTRAVDNRNPAPRMG